MPGTGYDEPINMANFPFPAAPMFPQMPFYPQQHFMPEHGAFMEQPSVPEAQGIYMHPPAPEQVQGTYMPPVPEQVQGTYMPPAPEQVQGTYMQPPVPQQVQGTYMQQPPLAQVQGMYAQPSHMQQDESSLFESSSYAPGTLQPFPAAGYGHQNYPLYGGGQQMPFIPHPGTQSYTGAYESPSSAFGGSSSIPHSLYYGHQVHAGQPWETPQPAPQQVMGQFTAQPSLEAAADDCGCGGGQPIPLHPAVPTHAQVPQPFPQGQGGYQQMPAGYGVPGGFQGTYPQGTGYYGQQVPGGFPQQSFPSEESPQMGAYSGESQQYLPESPVDSQSGGGFIQDQMMQSQPDYYAQGYGGQGPAGYGTQYGGQGPAGYGTQYGGQGPAGYGTQFGGQGPAGYGTQYGGQGPAGYGTQYGGQGPAGYGTQYGGQGPAGYGTQYGGQGPAGYGTQ
ncbi:hypothetical protein CUU66_08760, partial [Peribacillus deserti]